MQNRLIHQRWYDTKALLPNDTLVSSMHSGFKPSQDRNQVDEGAARGNQHGPLLGPESKLTTRTSKRGSPKHFLKQCQAGSLPST